jgi:NurA-like 5'-3' nuclease
VEEVEERWNEEVEGAVRRIQGIDWRGVREGVEERVGEVWRRMMGSVDNRPNVDSSVRATQTRQFLANQA